VETSERYRFVHGDICDAPLVDALLQQEKPDAIVHFAAESTWTAHLSPEPVIRTNFNGTLRCGRRAQHKVGRFVHVSTTKSTAVGAPLEATEDSLNPAARTRLQSGQRFVGAVYS